MPNGDVTTNEIMEFLEENVVTKEDLKEELKRFPTKEDLKHELERVATKEDLAKLKHDILDAMDQKNADLKADLVILMRKGDTKLVSLISLLKDKHLITEEEAKSVLSLEPFPQLSL